ERTASAPWMTTEQRSPSLTRSLRSPYLPRDGARRAQRPSDGRHRGPAAQSSRVIHRPSLPEHDPSTSRATGVLIAAPAAATDQDMFTTLIAAVTPPIGQNFKPKVACACPNNGVTLATAGFVMTDLFGKVRCGLPTSTPTEPWGWSRSPTTSRCSATELFSCL